VQIRAFGILIAKTRQGLGNHRKGNRRVPSDRTETSRQTAKGGVTTSALFAPTKTTALPVVLLLRRPMSAVMKIAVCTVCGKLLFFFFRLEEKGYEENIGVLDL
jgi:hypothetical protein